MSMDISAVEYTPFEDRLHTCFGDMLVYKSSQNTKFFADQSMPSFIRDWLMMRFSDAEGRIQNEKSEQGAVERNNARYAPRQPRRSVPHKGKN